MVVNKLIPLAEKLRPKDLNEVLGQDKVVSKNGYLGRMIEDKRISSFILWGPPGSGKTTIARLICKQLNVNIFEISAVFSGVNDLRKIFLKADESFEKGQKTILFVDEIHRFNKAQQDGFLSYIEKGIITLIGATTENPSFSLNSALLSRCQVFILNKLVDENFMELKKRAEIFYKNNIPLDNEAEKYLISICDGDGRYFLNLIEELANLGSEIDIINKEILLNTIQTKALNYDKNADQHFNLISALHKSLRSSDTDAALYWLARMLLSGEDPNYILRRLTRFANEDVGLADPEALKNSIAAWQAYERLGSPEGELAIVQLVIYLGTCPKSNSVYKAWNDVQTFTRKNGSLPPPMSILNAPTKLMKDMGYGKGYVYDHNVENAFSGQNCFPEKIDRHKFYFPEERGFEREIIKRLAWWDKLRKKPLELNDR